MCISNVGAYNIRIYKRVSTFVLFSTTETQTCFHAFSCFSKKHKRVSFPQLLTTLEPLETAGTIPFFCPPKEWFQCTVSARLYKEKFLFAFLGFLVMHNLHGRAQQGTVQIAQPRRGCASARVVVWCRLARRQGRGRGTCRATRNRHR